MSPSTDTGTLPLVYGQDVTFAQVAGPFDFVCAYVDAQGGSNSNSEWRLFATVNGLRSQVGRAQYSGRTAQLLQWETDQGTVQAVKANGTLYELVGYSEQVGPPTVKASIVGYNQFDTAADDADGGTFQIPANFAEITIATLSGGYHQFADIGVDQTAIVPCTLSLYALAGVGGVEAAIKQIQLQANDHISDVLQAYILPGATQYRLTVRANGKVSTVGPDITASLAVYSVDASSSSSAGGGSIIFRPGAASSGNFVETWAEVQAFIAAASGDCIVYVDDGIAAAHVPGSSGITEGFGRLEIRPYRSDGQNSSTLTVDDGATIRGLYRISNTIYLVSDCQSATPSFDWDYSANIVGTPFPVVYVSDRAGFGSAVTATEPAVLVPANSTLVVQFQNNGGIFQPPTIPFFRVNDPTATIIFTCYGAELRDNVGIILVPSTWVDGTGETSFDYDSPTVYNSVGLPQFSNTGAKHYHDMDTLLVEIVITGGAAVDILSTYQSSGRLAQTGNLQITIEGMGGGGGGGGGQGGAAIAGSPGDGGGGGAGGEYCMASVIFDLSHTLNATPGTAGAGGAAGVAGGGAGGTGTDGGNSAVTDATSLQVLASYLGASGGQGGGVAGTGKSGGASCGPAQYLTSTTGFSGAGGSGGVAGAAGSAGNMTTMNLIGSGLSSPGVGGTSAVGQGGGGGGGGASARGNAGGGGNSSAGIGAAGGAAGLFQGGGGGGGAGGTTVADHGGAGGAGAGGYIKVSFLGT